MDLRAHSGTLPTHTNAAGEPALGQELSPSSAHRQTESGGTILLQLLEFKTHLLEAVEELHIRRGGEVKKREDVMMEPDIPEQDAVARFENQINKLMLEKRELEWEKESLQNQNETLVNQHAESLISVKKQFQAKIRNIEEEKGKYQVSAEVKDREINSLKEELKSLQLLKHNLEKKSTELEQKLALQSKLKNSHVNQLGEVEKRFSALTRHCAMVKQAHDKLEQNVVEALKINKKLTSVNGDHEATIGSLKKELEEVSNKLVKAKMSSVRHDNIQSPTGRQQSTHHLQRKLDAEMEMNKKLQEEVVAVRAEKQEVMRSLQQTQQLLLSQTQTVNRAELELQTQRQRYQALKQEHEVMREKSKALEDKVVRLMEDYAASKTSWDKEKAMFLGCIKSEQQVQAVREAYSDLYQTHTGLSPQAQVHTQHIELKMGLSAHNLSVPAELFLTIVEENRGEETLNEPISSSELPNFGSTSAHLEPLVSTQTKDPDCLEDSALAKEVATGTTEGNDTSKCHQRSHFKLPLNFSNTFTSPLIENHFSLRSLCGTDSDSSTLNKHINKPVRNESVMDLASDFISTTSSVSDVGLPISKGSPVRDASVKSSLGCRGSEECVDLMSEGKSDDGNGGFKEKEQGCKSDIKQGPNNKDRGERNEEQHLKKEEVQKEEVKEARRAVKKRKTLPDQTVDRAEKREDSQRSTEDSGDPKQPEKETKDKAEGEGIDGVEEAGKTGLYTPEVQLAIQTSTDTTTKKSDTQQVIDFLATQPAAAACEPSDCLQKDCERDADSDHVREVHVHCFDEHQSVGHGHTAVFQEVQQLCHSEVQTFPQDAEVLSHSLQDFKESTEERPSDKLAAHISTEPLSQTTIWSSQTVPAPLAAQLETTATQPLQSNPSDARCDMKQADEMWVTPVSKPLVLLQSQKIFERESGQLKSLLTNDDGNSSAYMRECQSNVSRHENSACEAPQEPVEKANLKDACVDVMIGTVDLESEDETGSCQLQTNNEKIEDTLDAKTAKCGSDLFVKPSHGHAPPESSSEKFCEQSPAKEKLLDDTNDLPLPGSKTSRSPFYCSRAQRSTGSPVSELNTGGYSSSTTHMLLKSKHSKVPSEITRASDLLNASSVSGTAASSKRHQQGDGMAVGETTTADTESGPSLSMRSFPVSTSSLAVSKLPWETTQRRAPASTTGPSLESNWEHWEDQQSSFRAQISKIEQFLNTESFCLPKRRRTDN